MRDDEKGKWVPSDFDSKMMTKKEGQLRVVVELLLGIIAICCFLVLLFMPDPSLRIVEVLAGVGIGALIILMYLIMDAHKYYWNLPSK